MFARKAVGYWVAGCVAAGFGALVGADVNAQSLIQPPIVSVVDQNGVNLADGSFTLPGLEVGIGDAASGLFRSVNGSSDNYSASMKIHYMVYMGTAGPLVNDVSLNGKIYRFIIGGGSSEATATATPGPWAQVNGGNATLSCTGSPSTRFRNGTCTLTLPDGTQAIYDSTITNGSLWGYATSITAPDGEVTTINYKMISGNEARHIKSVRSSKGWMLKYESNTDYRITKVTAINVGQDYCDIAADSCSVPGTYPASSFSTVGSSEAIARNGTTIVSYSVSGNTTTITTPTGVTKTIVKDTSSRVTSVTMGGQTWNYAYTSTDLDKTTTVTAPNGTTRAVTTGYSGVKYVRDEVGRYTSYEYDGANFISSGRMKSVTTPDGVRTEYTYDNRGNITKKTEIPKGAGTDTTKYLVTTAEYASSCTNIKTCNKPLWVIDPNGVKATYTYHAASGEVETSTAESVGGKQTQTRFTYQQLTPYLKNAAGGLDPQSGIWRLTATSSCMNSNWTGTVCAAGTGDERQTLTTYSGNNLLPASVTTRIADNSVSLTTTRTYDNNGSVIVTDESKPGSVDEVYNFYDASGRLEGTLGGTAGVKRGGTRTAYDADGRAWKEQKGLAAASTYTGSTPQARQIQARADWQAMTILETDTQEYNSNGLPVIQRHYAGTDTGTPLSLVQTSYDNMLRVDCVANRLNPAIYSSLPVSACNLGADNADGTKDRIAKNTYHALTGLRLSTTTAYGTALASPDAVMSYADSGVTSTGQLEWVEDAKGNRTSYFYDSLNRLNKTCYPSATTLHQSSSTDCEQIAYRTVPVATGTSAQAGTLIDKVTLRDGQEVSFGYDITGRPTGKSGAVSETVSYDNFGQVITHTNNTTGGAAASTTYTYNALGWLMSEQQPMGTVSYLYDAYGKRKRTTWPDAFYVTYEYTAEDELAQICENGANCTTGQNSLLGFNYDNQGRRASIQGRKTDGSALTLVSYGYGTDRQLNSLTQPGNTITLGFNQANEIKSRVNSTSTFDQAAPATGVTTYTPNGLNQLAQISGTTISYDARGNLNGDGGGTYSYDANNLLVSATQSGVTANLTYDGTKRLLSVTKNGTTTKFLYDGVDLIAEYSASGTLLRRYVHGDGSDEPLVWYEGSGTADRRFLISDERGSITAVTDSTGAVQARMTYDAYGLSSVSGNTAYASRFRYTGQAWLPEVAMYYYKVRLYSPVLGRFLQPDPRGYDDGMNWYAYVGNDPINGIDPTGTSCITRGDDGAVSCNYTDEGCFFGDCRHYGSNSSWSAYQHGYTNSPTAPYYGSGFTGQYGVGGSSSTAVLGGMLAQAGTNAQGDVIVVRPKADTPRPLFRNGQRLYSDFISHRSTANESYYRWSLADASKNGGLIVQKVSGTDKNGVRRTYWEAWVVEKGSKYTTYKNGLYDDVITGWRNVTVKAAFYEGMRLPSSFNGGNRDAASGNLPSTRVDPGLPKPSSNYIQRSWP